MTVLFVQSYDFYLQIIVLCRFKIIVNECAISYLIVFTIIICILRIVNVAYRKGSFWTDHKAWATKWRHYCHKKVFFEWKINWHKNTRYLIIAKRNMYNIYSVYWCIYFLQFYFVQIICTTNWLKVRKDVRK